MLHNSTTLWLNGKIISAQEGFLSVMDRGFLLGDGIFETVRVVAGVPALFAQHWARLVRSANHYFLPLNYLHNEVLQGIVDLCNRNAMIDCVVRITLSRGAGGRGLQFDSAQAGTLLMTTSPLPPLYNPEGVALMVADVPRSVGGSEWAHKAMHCLASVAMMHKACAAGFDDALWCDTQGRILETCIANIFIVKAGILYTPAADGSILPGVMREMVIHSARNLGISVQEQNVTLRDLQRADEVFCTNAVRKVFAVHKIGVDCKIIAQGELTIRLNSCL